MRVQDIADRVRNYNLANTDRELTHEISHNDWFPQGCADHTAFDHGDTMIKIDEIFCPSFCDPRSDFVLTLSTICVNGT
jgi:hypothetical protein